MTERMNIWGYMNGYVDDQTHEQMREMEASLKLADECMLTALHPFLHQDNSVTKQPARPLQNT